ncbi:MAG: DUF421 domain-containing protein [Clostridia bacterium]|nr:DUF421 domain-containing protein [Clostridia bacterium]
MVISLIRAVILYAIAIFLIRLMGKRQIGELQPSELVITMLISEIASLPMQDNSAPMLNSIIALFVLVSLEILISALSLKFHKLRTLMQGHPVIIIRNGEIDVKALKKLRISLNDLLSALRQKDVFEISQVSYAIFETNGKVSVLLMPDYRNATASDLNLNPEDNGMPFAVICDGNYNKNAAKEAKIDLEETKRITTRKNLTFKDILLMTVNKKKKYEIIRKDKNS